jgi:membrane protein YdbS with pleckstrin-like domain
MSEAERQRIKQEFKRRRTRQLIVIFPVIISLIVICYLRYFMKNRSEYSVVELLAIVIAGVILAVIGVFSLFNWRCPSCNRYLGRSINPRFCPRCGISLR